MNSLHHHMNKRQPFYGRNSVRSHHTNEERRYSDFKPHYETQGGWIRPNKQNFMGRVDGYSHRSLHSRDSQRQYPRRNYNEKPQYNTHYDAPFFIP